MNKSLEKKIKAYKKQSAISQTQHVWIRKECQEMVKRLNLGDYIISTKEYRFLNFIREKLEKKKPVDLQALARKAGYTQRDSEKPSTAIIRKIHPDVFREIVGVDRSNIESELTKMILQDEDLTAKMRAMELATKIMGLQNEGNNMAIQINLGDVGFEVAD